MAAQVEVQTGEVGRTVAGGRLHLSPLTDSSNKSLIDIPSIITPEHNKPAPGPKPRLTPKPFSVEKTPTIRPILAPKPRPESTRFFGHKPELPCNPKPQQPVATGKSWPVSTNPNHPAPTSFKTSTKMNTGQTTKPIVQPFKPAPPLELGDPSKPTLPMATLLVAAERQQPGASSYSKSFTNVPAAEWSGTTEKEERDQDTPTKGRSSITRAKSMGFLAQIGQEEKEINKPTVAVSLRPQPRAPRPRPVSAVFLSSPTKTEAPVPAPRWTARRPLSADLTSKFESIGLSLHRKTPNADTKENTPEEKSLSQRQEKNTKNTTPQSTDDVAKPVLDQSNKKTAEITVKETDEDKRGVSIKSRISLLLDSSISPGAGVVGQVSDFHPSVQPAPETEPPVGVKRLIKQLTEDTPPAQSPLVKPTLKPRPLPLDLTKRFSSERSPDLNNVFLSDATERHENSKDSQRRIEEAAIIPTDQRTLEDLSDRQEQLMKASVIGHPEAGQTLSATLREGCPSGEVHTVRASLFENVVERHNVLMVDEGKTTNTAKHSVSSVSFRRKNSEDEGTIVTATYKDPVSPSGPLQVFHAFDTVQAVEESRAVSESIPSAQWEDKAMTLRSRRSERTGPAQEIPDQQPRYLRVGSLPKWTTTSLEHDADMEKGMLKQSQREGQEALNNDGDWRSEAENEEVAAAPKRLKMLQAEEQMKPRATYFALTGQIQDSLSLAEAGANIGDTAEPYDDFCVGSTQGSSQGKILPVRRNPSLDDTFGKISQDQIEELKIRSHIPHKEIRSALDGLTTQEMMEIEHKREIKNEHKVHKGKMKELEREKQRQLEMEKQHLEFARMKEREMQREYERQRQKAFEREQQEFEEKQRAQERQKQLEIEKQKLQDIEREKHRELERERLRQIEKEKRRELERQEIERKRQRELEMVKQQEQEKQRQREEERQRELEKERRLLEIQKEKQRMEELERSKELERKQLLEFQKQKQKEKERQQVLDLEKQRLREKVEREEAEKIKRMALEQEMLRLKELEKERERKKEMERERLKEMEREKLRDLERQRQRDLERERQKQLDIERQELENQKMRQRELEKEKARKEELERVKLVERRQLLEFENQKQAERERQQMLDFEKRRDMEKEEAEKLRLIAKQQEAERQRLKEKQKKEERERLRSEASPLRPQVLDLDAVVRNDLFSNASPQRSDPSTRWKEPSPRSEESNKPYILDMDPFTFQTQPSPSKSMSPSSVQSVDTVFGTWLQPTPVRDVGLKAPPQTAGITSPIWTTSPQDPWELRPVVMSVDKPAAEPRKQVNKLTPEQLLLRQEGQLLAPQSHRSAMPDESLHFAPFARTEARVGVSPSQVSSAPHPELMWLPKELQPQDGRVEVRSKRRSEGSQELNRMRSRSVSRRSAPSSSAVEGNLSRMRSRSAHREQDCYSWVQQKQSVSAEEEGKDSETPVRETDSQYGTWETGLRTDDSLTPATPSSESNFSPSPRKPTPSQTPGEHASHFDTDAPDGLPPSSSSSVNQPLLFPDTPTALLDNSALRSRAQLGKKRAPRTRPSRGARQGAAEGGTTEDWLYRDSTEEKVESKNNDSDSEEKTRADASPAAASQPQRIALFPGVDPSALKAQLKKRGDSDNQTEGPSASLSQMSRSPKSPFLPRAARVLPPPGGNENCEEDSPQWLKELKSKKRLSQYENDS